ncbi:uncharacterized protein V6R79_020487 [Siganus canaliculatus]
MGRSTESDLNLVCKLSYPREDCVNNDRKRKQTFENSDRESSKRKLENTEDREHIKRIKLGPSQQDKTDESSSIEKRTSGKSFEPTREINNSSNSSCFSEENCCSLVIVDDLSEDRQKCLSTVTSNPSGEQAFEIERLTDSSGDSSRFSEVFNFKTTAERLPTDQGNSSNILISKPSTGQEFELESLTDSSRDNLSLSEEDFRPIAKNEANSSALSEGTSKRSVPALTSTDYNSRTAFEGTYMQEKKIGQGAFGSVFAGYRKWDNLPVAIKHILVANVTYTEVSQHGKEARVPVEVALLQRLKDVPAVVTLLDWYNLESEVILVLERPVQCTDLFVYLDYLNGDLEEHFMKIIIQQLVDAFAEIHSRGVLHRDVHLKNILVELTSADPHVRIIDFGRGSFLNTDENKELVTVFQIGNVLCHLLEASSYYNFTKDFQDFLAASLSPVPTLCELQCHPWLNEN